MLIRIEDPLETSLDTQLETFFMIRIQPQFASSSIEILNQLYPLERFRHVKRIRRISEEKLLSILVCQESEVEDKNKEVLISKLTDNKVIFEEISLVSVPLRIPVSRPQYEKWNNIWPLVFHESMNEKLKEKQNALYSSLFMNWKSYFTYHALSLLIVECQDFQVNTELNTESELDQKLKFIVYENQITEFGCDSEAGCYPFDHFVMNSLTYAPKTKRSIINNKIPYLLSGCVAILRCEPCTMCSMALLHSRIDAVIYLNPNIKAGALGSVCLLHTIESLNHHFPVYQFIENK